MKVILGIDTSNYTTSVAAVTLEDVLLSAERQLLSVPSGERGLQQSKAVFQHIKNLPDLVSKVIKNIDTDEIAAICVSTKPRPIAGSYMPVFIVGENTGRVLASCMNIPIYESTHQEGHIMAGIWSVGGPVSSSFLAVHLSGGTTEILRVEKRKDGMDIERLGGTSDLHAGQFVDRIGVALGLSFPAGPALEKLAFQAEGIDVLIPSYVKGLQISFSGAESHAQRLIQHGEDHSRIALGTFHCIGRTLEKLISEAIAHTGLNEILLVGGVASNRIIRQYLPERLKKQRIAARLYFADPRFSGDNAVGTALLGVRMFLASIQGEVGL